MKIALSFLTLLLAFQNASAEQIAADLILANQHQVAMSEYSSKLVDGELSPSTADCPAAGFKFVEGGPGLSGGLMSAKANLGKLDVLAQAQAKSLSATNYCGLCQQTVYVTPSVITRPAKIAAKVFCDNRPTTSFEADFQTDKEAEDFSQNIINKKNQEGERLYAACPDPCAFSVYAGKRTLPNGKVHSTLTVNCGQPRNTSVLFAKYNFSFGTAVQWSCRK